MPDLIKSIWIDLLIGDKEEFFENDTFLSHGMNMSYAVENNEINFSYKGPRPGVTKNFRSDGMTELPIHDRTDTPEKVGLDNYSTDQFMLPKVDLFGLPYDKKASLMEDSRLALLESIAVEGLWAISPAAHIAGQTPIIKADSANGAATDNYDLILEADIMNLRIALDKAYPGLKKANWMLAVDTDAYWGLVKNSTILAEQYKFQMSTGNILSDTPDLKIFNFTIWCDDRTAWYNHSTEQKIAYNATTPGYTVGTSWKSALAYVPNKTFCTAIGTTQMFDKLNDPAKQADFVSFLSRAYVGPWGETAANLKYVGAIQRRPN